MVWSKYAKLEVNPIEHKMREDTWFEHVNRSISMPIGKSDKMIVNGVIKARERLKQI